jgi:hypothetical protein
MDPKARFRAWVVAAGGTFALALANALVDGWAGLGLTALQLAGLSWILWLLVTTPPGAIKLKRWLSVVLIVVGFTLIRVTSVPRTGVMDGSLSDLGMWLSLARISAVFAFVGLVLALPFSMRPRYRWGEPAGRASPWWAVFLLWGPLFGVTRFDLTAVGVLWGGASLLTIAAVLLGAFAPRGVVWSLVCWTWAVILVLILALVEAI